MYIYANIIDGKVAQIIEDELPFDELGRQKYAIGKGPYQLDLRDITGLDPQPQIGWIDVDGELIAPATMRTPEQARDEKRAAINAERNRREAASPFEYDGSLYDYDPVSRERLHAAISAALTAAAAGVPQDAVVATWTLYDNNTRVMTVADFLGFPAAEAARSGALHETARRLKAAVDAALEAGATAEEIDALPVWEDS